MTKRILAIDDEIGALESIKAVFWDGYNVLTAQEVREGARILREHRIDLLLLDIIMPDSDGMRFLKEVRSLYPDLPVIMVTAVTSNQTIAEAIRLGAVDFITKPFDVSDLRRVADAAITSSNLRRQQEAFRREMLHDSQAGGTMVGEASSFRKVLEEAEAVANTDDVGYIVGERGTGKKSLARYIHGRSRRSSQPFITLHCASLPAELAETEIFGEDAEPNGYAPSNALGRLGRLDLASSGTLVIQGVEHLSLNAQERLARAITTGVFFRNNGKSEVRTDARVVFCGMQRPDVEHGTEELDPVLREIFKKHVLEIPPLRDRPEDIPLLSYTFLNRYRKNMGVSVSDFESPAMDLMRKYRWPGNVREISNVIEGIVTLYGHERVVRPHHLPIEIQGARAFAANFVGTGRTFEEQTDEFHRRLIVEALEKANGIKNRAAEILGTTPRILSYRMGQLNIKPKSFVE